MALCTFEGLEKRARKQIHKAVKVAGNMAETARKAKEENVEKSAVILAEAARLKSKADERTAEEKAGAVTREAQNSTAKAKEAPAANEAAKRQAAKTKKEAARHAREARAAKFNEQIDLADRRKATGGRGRKIMLKDDEGRFSRLGSLAPQWGCRLLSETRTGGAPAMNRDPETRY